MSYTIVSDNKPSSVALHQKYAIVFDLISSSFERGRVNEGEKTIRFVSHAIFSGTEPSSVVQYNHPIVVVEMFETYSNLKFNEPKLQSVSGMKLKAHDLELNKCAPNK